ncbi:MAG: CoA transferase [Halioglobus sp.]|nr:CoA transferase [Halioglobus sp.]|tara:strand:+ start:4290 stop:5477 length:1188 start_codon:yes stop_codon:yes gene_type:complete
MGPLDGLKVVDLTTMVSGQVASMMLADQGAHVIKVEPLAGEQMRHIGPPHNGVASGFFSCNRGKESISLDLKSEEGKKILLQLAESADVFIQNFRPGAIERMGFSEEVLREINEKLIYVSISGFGEHGPYTHKRVYDPVIQALTGATDIQADRETGRPQMFRIIIADKVTSLAAAQAISSALYAREKTGEGQHIRLSMLDTMLSFFWPEGMAGLTFADMEFDVTQFQGKMDLIYETQDRYITAGAVSDKEWAAMCRAIEREDLIEDPRFKTSSDRFVNGEERKTITAAEIIKWSSEEILERLDREGVPCAPLLNRMELIEQEQIIANDSIQKIQYPGFGEVRQPRPAARFDKTPAGIAGPGPRLGQHSREILGRLGYTDDEVEALVAGNKVLASE